MNKALIEAKNKFKKLPDQHKDLYAVAAFGTGIEGSDQYSDLDVMIVTSNVDKYLDEYENSWLHTFGKVISRRIEKQAIGSMHMNRIILSSGFRLDVLIFPLKVIQRRKLLSKLKKYRITTLFPKGILNKVSRSTTAIETLFWKGTETLYDRIGLEKIIANIIKENPRKQKLLFAYSERNFEHNYNQFWQNCFKLGSKLHRGDFYYAYIIVDSIIKSNLLRMIEWHTLYVKKGDYIDQRFVGSKIKQWATPEIVEELYNVFLHSDIDEMREALISTMNLFRKISVQIASEFKLKLNKELEQMTYDHVYGKHDLKKNQNVLKVINDLQDIAEKEPTLQAIVSYGSYAAKKHFDEYSDLDVYCFVVQEKRYAQKAFWNEVFDNLLSFYIRRIDSSTILSIQLKGGFSIDIRLVDITKFQQIKRFFWLKNNRLEKLLPKRIRGLFQFYIRYFYNSIDTGYGVIYDVVGIETVLEEIIKNKEEYKELGKLSNRLFSKNYTHFWQTSYRLMIKFIRDDFFAGIMQENNIIKKRMIEMLGWEKIIEAPDVEVLSNGRKISSWCDRNTINEILTTFPHSNPHAMKIALLKTLKLYQKTSHVVAAKYGFKINVELEKLVLNFVTDNMKSEKLVSVKSLGSV